MRLFVGLSLPGEICESLAKLSLGLPGASWVAGENMHITLSFIGEVDSPRGQDIDNALAGGEPDRHKFKPHVTIARLKKTPAKAIIPYMQTHCMQTRHGFAYNESAYTDDYAIAEQIRGS